MKIIKIGASWCSGCIIMRPIWESIEKERKINTEYYDYDIYEETVIKEYNIGDKLPVIIFLDKDNNELERIVGETSKSNLLSLIERYGDK